MAKSRSFTLSRAGRADPNDIFAQLQAPAQRAASLKVMSEAVSKGVPTIVPPIERVPTVTPPHAGEQSKIPNEPVFRPTIIYNKAPTYEAARRAADVAAMKQTIDPKQLVAYWSSGGEKNINPSNIANAYLNPVAEGAYNTSPQFDWSGRQVAGIGASRTRQTPTDAMMYDLQYGKPYQRKLYQDALDKSITDAQYQASVAESAAETARYRAQFKEYQDYAEQSYQRARNQGQGIPHQSVYVTLFNPGTPYQQQMAALQRSQTTLSRSFGSGDAPNSLLTGYRL